MDRPPAPDRRRRHARELRRHRDPGDLEPIVFVHGLGGQWQNWLENLPRAAQERRVIAMDLPGFGLLADAARQDHDPRLRTLRRRPLRAARSRPRGHRGQLDGRLHRRRGGDPVPASDRPADPGLGGRDHHCGPRAAPGADAWPDRRGHGYLRRVAPAPDRIAAEVAPHGAAARRPPPLACCAPTSPTRASSRGRASPASTTPCARTSSTTSATACPSIACPR